MCDDGDVRCVNVLVGVDEVCTQYRGEELGRIYWILFGRDVRSLFHGICWDNDTVIGLGITVLELVNHIHLDR